LRDFRNIIKYQILLKSFQWEPNRETDRQTDITKLILAFRNFANALKSISG